MNNTRSSRSGFIPIPPAPQPSRPRQDSRRSYDEALNLRIVGVIGGVIACFITYKLFMVQVINRKTFAGQSGISMIRHVNDSPRRGIILDRNGRALTKNIRTVTIVFDGNSVVKMSGEPEKLMETTIKGVDAAFPGRNFSDLLPKASEIQQSRDGKRTVRFKPIEVVKNCDVNRIDLVTLAGQNLPGIGVFHAMHREQSADRVASSILGEMGTGHEGLSGLEYSQNERLTGTSGDRFLARDLNGVIPGTEKIISSVRHGEDIVLTIDTFLQAKAEELIRQAVSKSNAQYGSIIILDAKTGDILVMANATGKAFVPEKAKDIWFYKNKNWAVEGVYEPGSTLKSVTLATALEQGVVNSESSFTCSGDKRIGTRTVHCSPHGAFQHGHGTLPLAGVLEHSCNVATSQIATRVGWDSLTSTLKKVHCADKLSIGLVAAARGIMPTAPSSHNLACIGFGQSLAISPLHLASIYTTFVDGNLLAPRLIHAYRNQETKQTTIVPRSRSERVFSQATASSMRGMLEMVINSGTGMQAQLINHSAGGKTGTAQMTEKGRYNGKYMASFIGLAPINKPRFIVVVTVAAPKGDHFGGSVAAPIFKRITETALVRYDIMPDIKRRGTTSVSSRTGAGD